MHDWYVAHVWSLSEQQASALASGAREWVGDLSKLDPEANSQEFLFACRRCGRDYKHAAGHPCGSDSRLQIPRNRECHCGSGRKYKHCCGHGR
jgi:SEC-C motif